MYILEDRKLLNNNQAGFRQGRCTTDQVLKLVQEASDTMHRPKAESHRTTAAFFDYEKAYDKVWRDGLLSKMQELCIPNKFVRYVRHFLSGRKTRVAVNGVRSNEFTLKEGLPQGSCIAPLLFLVFINDIDIDLDMDTTASLFADDTATWRRDGKIQGSDRILMQGEIDKITSWAEKWKMRVNGSKTKSMVISSSQKDQEWDPKFTVSGKQMETVSEYRFLGVKVSNDLRFIGHVDTIVDKCARRNAILKCLSTKNWGNSPETQKMLYLQYDRSVLEFASPSFHTWLSMTQMKRLQRLQNDALRTIAGLAKTCPVDFLHLETGIEPLQVRYIKNDMVTYERYARLPVDDPRRQLIEKNAPTRLKTRLGWRQQTKQRMNEFQFKRAVTPGPSPPWRKNNIKLEAVKLEKKKSEYSSEELNVAAMETIRTVGGDHLIYTDGSTSGSQQDGGAGVFVTNKEGEVLVEASFPAGRRCSSYTAECIAMSKALDWVSDNPGDNVIISDSMSMFQALKSNNWKDTDLFMREIKDKLAKIEGETTLLWVPSHCEIHGNDKADRLADRGTRLDQSDVPVSQKIVIAKIRGKKWSIEHARAKATYKDRRKPKFDVEKTWPRNVRMLYARLRTGHAKELAYYRYLIEADDDPMCECGKSEETIQHVMCECELLQSTRDEYALYNATMDTMVFEPDQSRIILSERFPGLKIPEEPPDETHTLC